MKDEIPQAVIDSHVKNAASARAEKVKQETSEETTGTLYKYNNLFYSCVLSYLAYECKRSWSDLALTQTSLLFNVNANQLV